MEPTIEKYRLERARQITIFEEAKTTMEAAKARIAQIDDFFKAYRNLTGEDVLPDVAGNKSPHDREPDASSTEAVVMGTVDMIAQIKGGTFTLSDVVSRTGHSRQTDRRVLNALADHGMIRIVEQGFRRKPTIYEVIKTE